MGNYFVRDNGLFLAFNLVHIFDLRHIFMKLLSDNIIQQEYLERGAGRIGPLPNWPLANWPLKKSALDKSAPSGKLLLIKTYL